MVAAGEVGEDVGRDAEEGVEGAVLPDGLGFAVGAAVVGVSDAHARGHHRNTPQAGSSPAVGMTHVMSCTCYGEVMTVGVVAAAAAVAVAVVAVAVVAGKPGVVSAAGKAEHGFRGLGDEDEEVG